MRVAPLARAFPLLVVALLVLVAVLAATAGARHLRSRSTEAELQHEILRDLNAIRTTHGLVPLRLSEQLAAAAQQHTSEMLRRGYFSHSSADGLPYWKRIMGYYPMLPGAGYSVGENLLWTQGQIGAGGAVAMWMRSPEHRRNILLPAWREIGIAVETSPDAPGFFGDRPVTVADTDFGIR